MSTKDMAINIVNMMDEEQLTYFVKLFNRVVSDIPNNGTIEAMKESERLINDKNAQKFDSVDSLFEELESWNTVLNVNIGDGVIYKNENCVT